MEFYNQFLKQLVLWQYELNSYISTTIRGINDENSFSLGILVLTISFIYGLIHAAGPGHGKALVAFYFLSNKQKNNYKKAFKIGYMISIIHATSALIFTFAIFFILKTMFRKNFNDFSFMAMYISSLMIMLVGIYLIYQAYKHKKEKEKKFINSNKSENMIALSAGIVPCPGVMTVVLFCIVLGHYTLGILAAITMSIGMGFTISLAGILSISINKKSNLILQNNAFILEMIASFLVFLLGLFLFLGLN